MLFGKKKKISQYLTQKQCFQELTAFDNLLSQYLGGELKQKLSMLDFNTISFHIDWLADYKCIGVQAKFGEYFFDIQIFQDLFAIAYDEDEPNCDAEFELTSVTAFYNAIENIISKLN